MKRFVFSLRAVLEHRERIEEEKQRIFADRQRDLMRAQAELKRLDAEFRSEALSLRNEHRTLTADQLRAYYAHFEYLDRCITASHAEIARHCSLVESARLELVEAGRDRKIMEKLKEHRLEEHRALVAAGEQAELDDANNRRSA